MPRHTEHLSRALSGTALGLALVRPFLHRFFRAGAAHDQQARPTVRLLPPTSVPVRTVQACTEREQGHSDRPPFAVLLPLLLENLPQPSADRPIADGRCQA